MRMFLAIVYGFLNLVGCTDAQNRSMRVSSSENGTTVLDARTDVDLGRAEFTCNASRSGHCYYAVFYEGKEIRTFVLSVAERRRLDGLPAGFEQCVGAEPSRMSPSCRPL
ncbi:hypothetical protein L2Y94_08655 [Luteibacter aegosomatis]|uniref:hypothetical protein n=1 Tax=Luteibacter aegosomatis TaxID=2911537 RepID=UPI001FFA2144|nr:hypothetical protein [Luteibacter aegosomatis]UPG87407.1 hypothetical protein L2Y94_08655 [Luteibacter aegosomatis]